MLFERELAHHLLAEEPPGYWHEDYPLQLGMTRKEYGGSNAISIFRLSAPSVPVRHNIPSGGVRHWFGFVSL